MSTINFDLSEPDVANMVNQWEAGGKYRVELNITLGSNDGKTASATVDEVSDYGDASESDASEDTEEDQMPPETAPTPTEAEAGAMEEMGSMMGSGQEQRQTPKAVVIAMMGKKKK